MSCAPPIGHMKALRGCVAALSFAGRDAKFHFATLYNCAFDFWEFFCGISQAMLEVLSVDPRKKHSSTRNSESWRS